MAQHYMTYEERIRLETLLGEKRSVAYSAWEKGTVENHNRMIRRFFPKGTNFDEVSPKEIRRVQDWMNQYPRKSLSWHAPEEIAG